MVNPNEGQRNLRTAMEVLLDKLIDGFPILELL
jgi:hypothetical protein